MPKTLHPVSGGWGWRAPGRHSWRDPDWGNPQVLLQKPIYVMTFSATVAKKALCWGANGLVKTVWIRCSASNLVLLVLCGLFYGAQRFLLWWYPSAKTKWRNPSFSVLIFPNILKITGSKHYSRFCFDFFHSPRLMAYAPSDLTRCWWIDQLLVMAEIIYQDKWPVCWHVFLKLVTMLKIHDWYSSSMTE